MSWFESMKEPRKTKQREVSEDTEKTDLFRGNWEDAERDLGELPRAIETLMNYALNGAKGKVKGRKGVRDVGESMVLQINGVVCGTRDNPEAEVGLGDYEIEVRRVR